MVKRIILLASILQPVVGAQGAEISDRCSDNEIVEVDVRLNAVSEFTLQPSEVLKILTKEFGGNYFRGHVTVLSKNYAVTRPFLREVGKFAVTFTDDIEANSLFQRASQQAHFRTREIYRSYSVKKEGKTIVIYYADSVFSLMQCKKEPCDLECLFFALSDAVQKSMGSP